MTGETFSDRLKLAMEQRGKKQIDMIRAAAERGVKLGKSHISQYVSGKNVPRADILHCLADILDVDEEWLRSGRRAEKAEQRKEEERAEVKRENHALDGRDCDPDGATGFPPGSG